VARSWGNGSPTEKLHHVAFDLYESLAAKLGCTSYRKLPVLSVSPGYDGLKDAAKKKDLAAILPSWLDGKVGRISALGYGDETAQITPLEFVDAMLAATADRVTVVKGTCVGVESDQGSARGARKVTAVQYENGATEDASSPLLLPADCVVVAAGPWSTAAEDWFPHAGLQLPMEGVKSTSIVWKAPTTVEGTEGAAVDATALFCGEDGRFGTHCKFVCRGAKERSVAGVTS
jgi:glycine/D-amino acid oxidase-like deaminating enzyme